MLSIAFNMGSSSERGYLTHDAGLLQLSSPSRAINSASMEERGMETVLTAASSEQTTQQGFFSYSKLFEYRHSLPTMYTNIDVILGRITRPCPLRHSVPPSIVAWPRSHWIQARPRPTISLLISPNQLKLRQFGLSAHVELVSMLDILYK